MEKYYLDERGEEVLQDPIEIYGKAIKVHTRGIDLNEDATLSKLDAEMPKLAKYVTEQQILIAIIKTFLKSGVNIIKFNNKMDKWGEQVCYQTPELNEFNECKLLLMNKVNSVLILSRSTKGMPLKSFLTYGRESPQKLEEHKRSLLDRALGRNIEPKEEEEY